jgi:DNA invertase Pin-like site-specific DNA recombinase
VFIKHPQIRQTKTTAKLAFFWLNTCVHKTIVSVNIGVYIRSSTTRQSTASQRIEVMEYCSRRGWADLKLYNDKCSGGKASRPGLDQMLQDIRRGRLKTVVVWKLDRLGRSLTQMALILEEMSNHGVALIVTSQGIDTSNTNPAGKLQLNVLMAVAEFERGIIRERVNAGLKAAKQRGVKLGRPRSLHKKTGAVLCESRNGLGVRAIARKLQMAPSSVHKILKNVDVN